jgi:hypothetical protein
VAATALIDLCQPIGPENTSIYVLPQLKELFAELAFSHDSSGLNHSKKDLKVPMKIKTSQLKWNPRSLFGQSWNRKRLTSFYFFAVIDFIIEIEIVSVLQS